MHKFFKSSLLLVAALAPIILALQPAYVDAQTQNAPSPRRTQHEDTKRTDDVESTRDGKAKASSDCRPS